VASQCAFVIDPSGTIRYAANAAIAWDDPALIAALHSLLHAPGGGAQ
jgi:hypothetical protein